MHDCFAIFPDDPSPAAGGTPIAVFDCLEDAMNWGLERFKGGAFRLKYQRLVLLETDSDETLDS
jgi:hypothetical protein